MKVAPTQPFKIVYAVFQHQYLGYLFEAFVVQANSKGELTFLHQSLSAQNAHEFAKGLDDKDLELIRLTDALRQEYILKKFYSKKIKPADFFLKVYENADDKNNKALIAQIDKYIEQTKQKIIQRLAGKLVYITAKDGNPIGKELQWATEPATVLFHFRRNEENTHYFPTIKYQGQKLDFMYKGAFLLANEPAWLVLEDTIYHFADGVDGQKLKPFLNKKFIVIPRKVEASYYEKFVSSLVASFDVYAKGFDIKPVETQPRAVLSYAEYAVSAASQGQLFGENPEEGQGSDQMLFQLHFDYGGFQVSAAQKQPTHVVLEPKDDSYIFYKINRRPDDEQRYLRQLSAWGLEFKHGTAIRRKTSAFGWLNEHQARLPEAGIVLEARTQQSRKYFVGTAKIEIQIKENNDWFDIFGEVQFGEFNIPFIKIRQLILQSQMEFALPNGQIAVIPQTWFEQYSTLLSFSEAHDNQTKLRRYHLAIVQDLQAGAHAQVSFSHKLERFRNFEQIEDYPMPEKFKGELRSYQKAGYNWMRFLQEYHFGGCLADDMGLGKTVQTLALIQAQYEDRSRKQPATLLVIPTSLIYNWQLEAHKFTPDLRVLVYAGPNRNKDVAQFAHYDLIITSYGIVRVDIELLSNYHFHYVILDESQAIKNPTANVSQAVRKLQARHRLLLTGTPLENSTLDLWSQMSFINPGLLGSQAFFKQSFLNPIEKQGDAQKAERLATVIKPFILRRHKAQVAKDLPEKVVNLQYCTMTPAQAEHYEQAKDRYRNEILNQIEQQGMAKTQMLIFKGLTELRQIANHPRMVDEGYQADSGKMEDVLYKVESLLSEGSKVLIFSQFVKHLSLFRTHFDRQGWGYAYLDGATTNRQAQVERFQEDPNTSIFLLSLKAGGVGLNLTAAEYVFLLDPWWNPAIEAQAIDRAHRIGQQNTVFAYKFITQNTVEEKILALQQRKQQLAENLITAEDSFVKSLSKEDVLSLLS
jgi:hypothetical protein|nr:DEAD/DEAH box helicase [Eisenibacter elegans]